MDDFQFLPCLVLPLGLQCLPFPRLLSLQPSAYPAAPFWLLLTSSSFSAQLVIISLSSIWSLSFSHSACALSYDICISKALITIFIQWIPRIFNSRLSFGTPDSDFAACPSGYFKCLKQNMSRIKCLVFLPKLLQCQLDRLKE